MPTIKAAIADTLTTPEQLRAVAREAGIPTRYINLTNNPAVNAAALLKEAENSGKLDLLLKNLRQMFPNVPWFSASNLSGPEGPDIATLWHPAPEVLTTGKSLMVGVDWLRKGYEAAESVVRVCLPGIGYGSGIIIDGLYLVTNHHVIESEDTASGVRIDFMYDDRTGKGWSTQLNPKEMFVTDKALDLTIVAIVDHQARSPDFRLERVGDALEGGYCQIIQHPSGWPKMLGVYNNLVVWKDDLHVQYLTDTMPGSSGSPVFNEKWELIAIHHSGGFLRAQAQDKSGFANEGVLSEHIHTLLERAVPHA